MYAIRSYYERRRYLPQGIVKGSELKLRRLDPGKIPEEVENSWFATTGPLHPYDGQTVPSYNFV